LRTRAPRTLAAGPPGSTAAATLITPWHSVDLPAPAHVARLASSGGL
jgi:hypothetical protein